MNKLEQAAEMAVNVLEGLGYDPVDKMEASDPSLTAAINAIAKATGRVYERT